MPVAPSLCVNPIPPRITRKSTRPRASDRTMVDIVQPQGLPSFRNRMASSRPQDGTAEKEQIQAIKNVGHERIKRLS